MCVYVWMGVRVCTMWAVAEGGVFSCFIGFCVSHCETIRARHDRYVPPLNWPM